MGRRSIGCRYMVTPDPEKYDPEKHVTGSLGLALGLGLTLTL